MSYFVSGAAGHLGRAVIHHLTHTLKIVPQDIIAGTRDPAKLADLAANGVQVRKADFDDEAGLVKALTGAEHFLLISTDALDKPGRRLEQHQRAVKAAEKAGVTHIVYTSLPNADTSAVSFAPDHLGTEKAIAASKIANHTILRNNWYFENILHAIQHALQSGAQYSAAGNGKLAHISRDDLALAAATALVKGQGKQAFTLSGAKLYTTSDIAALVSKLAGKPINVVAVPLEGLIQGMVGAGIPEPVARVFASFDTAISKGNLEGDASDFKKLTGKEPGSFEDWLQKNKAAFTAAA